mmetsp:Transcript_45617/g.117968  ORF Transcript_45617/g.117968 Transcript_45617/m.117968 type:complete len:80 (+) Transcript_45617:759-998(+)
MPQLHSEQQPTLRVPAVNQTLTSRPGGTSPGRVVLFHRYQTQTSAAMNVQMYILVTHHQDRRQKPSEHHLIPDMATEAT